MTLPTFAAKFPKRSPLKPHRQWLVSCAFLLGLAIATPPAIAGVEHLPTLTVAQQNAEDPEAPMNALLEQGKFAEVVTLTETMWEEVFEDYFGNNLSEVTLTGDKMGAVLARMGQETDTKPALIYMIPHQEQLELLLVTPDGEVRGRRISEANNEALMAMTKELRYEITNPIKRNSQSYLTAARQLYDWTIAPFEAELQGQNIDTLLFCVGPGLRSLPFAALHDGEGFLVEKYSLALIPAFNMIDLNYRDLQNAEVLAMGASIFDKLPPLPAVPVELTSIARALWKGNTFLNFDFTLDKLRSELQKPEYGIVHLATHADFVAGNPNNSYIQLWGEKLTLNDMRELDFARTSIALLVLSACNTAVGNEDAEKGFAGLAVNSGIPSALASLWYVSDAGTLALMSEFYRQLKGGENGRSPIKAEALRQAQIAMIRGEVTFEDGALRTDRGNFSLPDRLADVAVDNLSHPYFWAAFTAIGSPW